MLNKFYTVSYFTNFGLRMYLSNVGFHIAAGKGQIFEPEFRNAQKFLTKTEAKQNAKAVEASQNLKTVIQKHEIHDDGSTQITVVK